MDSLQVLSWLILAGLVGLVLMILVLLAMGVHALISRVRAPQAAGHAAPRPPKRKPRQYHRMSPDERRAWRAAHGASGETGEFRHA